jgi:beta-glucosidase-like glycosyl hydrolase
VNAADELAWGLDRARAEQAQAKAKAGLGIAMDRSATTLADLWAAQAEVESLEKEHARTAVEAVARAREAGKAVEDLAAELATLKGELESSRASHVEAAGMVAAVELGGRPRLRRLGLPGAAMAGGAVGWEGAAGGCSGRWETLNLML